MTNFAQQLLPYRLRHALVPLLALALAAPAFAETLKGTARGKSGAIRVLIEMKADRPTSIDLQYSPVTVLKSSYSIDPPLTEYNGEPGTGFRAMLIYQTFRTHLRLKALSTKGGNLVTGRLLATGTTTTESKTVINFIPDSGAARFRVESDPTSSSKSFRDTDTITVRGSSTGGRLLRWNFKDSNSLHGTDEVTISLQRLGTGAKWRVVIFTRREFSNGDVDASIQSTQSGILRSR